MAKILDCRGDLFTGEQHASTDAVPGHIAIGSVKTDIRESGGKRSTELFLRIEREASSRLRE